MSESNILQILSKIQKDLNVPKNRKNEFQKYKYRNLEDILDALKKIMPDDCAIILNDCIEQVGDRYYVKATATFHYGEKSISAHAYAREPLTSRTNQADQQITGSTSSYSRRYALNALFAIDDFDDTEENDTGLPIKQRQEQKPQTKLESSLINKDDEFLLSQLLFDTKTDKDKFMSHYRVKSLSHLTLEQHKDAIKNLNAKINQQMKPEYKPEDYARV